MARLMAIPLRDDGAAILIVTRCADKTLMGYVAEATIEGFFDHRPSTCQCLMFVERHLSEFERILQRKSASEDYDKSSLACIEIGIADLTRHGLASLRQT